MKHIVFFGALLIPSVVFAHGELGTIEVTPTTLNYTAGAEVPVEVRIRAPESITALSIRLIYDPAVLEVKQVDPNTNSFPYWWKQEAANGVVALEASLPEPGFTGEDLVASLVVTAKQGGNRLLDVDKQSSLLLNSKDQNILEYHEESSPPTDYAPLDSGISGDFEKVGSGTILGMLLLLIGGVTLGVLLFLRLHKKS